MSAPPDLSADRFRRLHSAQRVITSELVLETMLERIVEAACDVLDVRCAILAVLAPDNALEHLVHRGVAQRGDDSWLLGHRTGRQVAQAVLDRASHPHAGDRDGSTDTRSVDVLIAGEVYAQLHVADPVIGRFSAEDDEMIRAMARSVGSALEHAQLFDRAQRSTEWLHASGEIARALLADADVDMFGEIVARAMAAADGDYAQLVVPTAAGDLKLIATAGLGAEELLGAVYPSDTSDLSRSIVNAKTMRMPDLNELLSSDFDNHHHHTAFMIAPLLDALGTRGSIMITRVAGRAAFNDYELDLFATYAAQVALAMQFADARADSARMQLLETRHDTARELHDIVMQRLFATGVGMHTLVGQLAEPAQADQLRRYVCELDDTIDQIRARVFGLRGDAQSPEPAVTRFPRIALDGLAAAPIVVREPPRRGRRRSDWHDGTGRPQA